MIKNLNIERTPLYFGEQGRSLFGWYHTPKNQQTKLAMVVCPPIGHEYVHSHRTLRHLADELARAGIACLRFDYHGIGDSTGVDEDPSRVSSWLENIRQALFQVKILSGCDEVGLVGFRIGATLAALISENNYLACLVLWAPCIRGRNYIREMKALRMSGATAPQANDNTNSNIETAGFILTEQTVKELSTIDLHKIIPNTNKILVVMRDDLAEASQRLDQWTDHDIDLNYQKFSGYSDIVAEPHDTKVPFDTIKEITNWISTSSSIGNNNEKSGAVPEPNSSISVPLTDYEQQHFGYKLTDIRESIYTFGKNNHLFGILCEPLINDWKNRPTLILTNAGAVHHIGPNRLYVLLTRNIARAGFRCLRMDLSGLGDSFIEDISKENDSYISSATKEIEDAINSLRLDGSSFVVMGLCSGAHTAFHVALDLISQPIDECILINPLTFYWNKSMSLSTTPSLDIRWHYYKNTMQQKDRWMKLIQGRANIKAIVKTIVDLATKRVHGLMINLGLTQPTTDNLNYDIKQICLTGRELSFIFSSTDPGYEILMSNAKSAVRRFSKKELINIQYIQNADHTFTTDKHRLELTNKLINHLVKRYS
jgi:dienelactone hydrolase